MTLAVPLWKYLQWGQATDATENSYSGVAKRQALVDFRCWIASFYAVMRWYLTGLPSARRETQVPLSRLAFGTTASASLFALQVVVSHLGKPQWRSGELKLASLKRATAHTNPSTT